MTTVKIIQDIVICLAVVSALVIAFWIFPRLFLASYSPKIWQSIRRHPIIHLFWGLAGLLAIYLVFRFMTPVIARN